MHKLALIGATVIGSVILSVSPFRSVVGRKGFVSVSDKAVAEIRRPAMPEASPVSHGEPTDERCGAARRA